MKLLPLKVADHISDSPENIEISCPRDIEAAHPSHPPKTIKVHGYTPADLV
jgi:hypothetical protein